MDAPKEIALLPAERDAGICAIGVSLDEFLESEGNIDEVLMRSGDRAYWLKPGSSNRRTSELYREHFMESWPLSILSGIRSSSLARVQEAGWRDHIALYGLFVIRSGLYTNERV